MIQPQYFQQAYPQTPSAVSINIYEPKSYASAPNQIPYGYTNELYSMPQNSLWAAQPQGYAQSPVYYPQQGQVQYQPAQIINQQPPIYFPQQGQAPYQPQQVLTPAPAAQVQTEPVAQQEMPQSAIEEQTQAEAAKPAQETQMPAVEKPDEAMKIDTNALVADLKSTDPKAQYEAITSIANFTVASPDLALQVATDPIKQALADVIKSDTSKLPDLATEKANIEAKKQKGEKLTPEEEATLAKNSPKLEAERNKAFAMFSLAMVQKVSRDNVEQYAKSQAEQGKEAPVQLGLNQLIGYNEIVNAIKNESNSELRTAAIQALQYMARPEESAEVEGILTPITNDADSAVSSFAKDAIAKLGQQDTTEATQQDASKVA